MHGPTILNEFKNGPLQQRGSPGNLIWQERNDLKRSLHPMLELSKWVHLAVRFTDR